MADAGDSNTIVTSAIIGAPIVIMMRITLSIMQMKFAMLIKVLWMITRVATAEIIEANPIVITEAELISFLPQAATISRFEIVAGSHDTEHKINTTNKLAAKQLVIWLKEKKVFPFDPHWFGSYRPALSVKLWISGKKEPKYILIYPEWKDTRGKIHTMSQLEVDLLMNAILKARRK